MTYDDALARDMAEYTESPSEREERESIQAGVGIVPDSVWVEWQDEVAEDLAEEMSRYPSYDEMRRRIYYW